MKYSSKDFHMVDSELKATMPTKLLHKNVMGNQGDNDITLSKERKHLVKIIDLPTQTISITIGGLAPLEVSGKHRHNYESVIYILEGAGITVIDDKEISWEKGDAIYIPPLAWHQHSNKSTNEQCLYLACENAPLLQNLGNIAFREEVVD